MIDRITPARRSAARARRQARAYRTASLACVLLVVPLVLSPWPGASMLAWVGAFLTAGLSLTLGETARAHDRAAVWARRNVSDGNDR